MREHAYRTEYGVRGSEDTIEFFNLVLELKLSEGEKADLLAYLYVL